MLFNTQITQKLILVITALVLMPVSASAQEDKYSYRDSDGKEEQLGTDEDPLASLEDAGYVDSNIFDKEPIKEVSCGMKLTIVEDEEVSGMCATKCSYIPLFQTADACHGYDAVSCAKTKAEAQLQKALAEARQNIEARLLSMSCAYPCVKHTRIAKLVLDRGSEVVKANSMGFNGGTKYGFYFAVTGTLGCEKFGGAIGK